MSASHAFPLVTVSGSAYAMGAQHGEQAAPLIQRYLLLIERMTKLSRDVLCRNALRFAPLIEKSISSTSGPSANRATTIPSPPT